ncbi:Nif3-like dinuclear metal center hexameric protein [Puniceicoccus vermicola]|uniref:Nif3-like dinuclear metal center hexameric protein n=1 Tax=Puniceicoccus vermicola TaxID=388746 RepID=A0A7X1E3X3_9BACT|nr:Nif3-like dinuclear metal center hexameric protein [Puniceicoccus vermicola]MBC2601383.1 Nif3-like dinuclear metal center hexameric protein [Puniceicoccus vermicola]
MVELQKVVSFCDRRTRRKDIRDFPPAHNGLQIENNGVVTKIGAAVDAGERPFQIAAEKGIDFLIVHHGLYWVPPVPLTGPAYRKTRTAIEKNLAVYGSHLPLDCHPEIGNNALLAKALDLTRLETFLPYEGNNIGLVTNAPASRDELKYRLERLFPGGVVAMEEGSERPQKIAILTGSGSSAVEHLAEIGVDTLITGELKQHFFNIAQEEKLNLFACGHYRTETFGVRALAEETAKYFDLPCEFVATDCPL